MWTTTSAVALKNSALAKTNPINRLTITCFLFFLGVKVRTTKLFSVGKRDTEPAKRLSR
jgi:hypothetical protein